MTVIYESAFTVMCDSPDNYRDQPGANFLKRIETSWDETRYLDGYPGEFALVARRKGDIWYMGALTVSVKKDFQIRLDFLDSGKEYEATKFKGSYKTVIENSTEKFEYTQYSYYAKGIGLAKMEKEYSDGKKETLELTEIMTIDEWNKRQ